MTKAELAGGSADASARKVGLAAVVTTAGVAAACAACCVVPIAIPAVALAGFGGVFAWFAGAHGWMSGLGLLAVVGGWAWVAAVSLRTPAPPRRATVLLLSVASLLLLTALAWPVLEPYILRALRG